MMASTQRRLFLHGRCLLKLAQVLSEHQELEIIFLPFAASFNVQAVCVKKLRNVEIFRILDFFCPRPFIFLAAHLLIPAQSTVSLLKIILIGKHRDSKTKQPFSLDNENNNVFKIQKPTLKQKTDV